MTVIEEIADIEMGSSVRQVVMHVDEVKFLRHLVRRHIDGSNEPPVPVGLRAALSTVLDIRRVITDQAARCPNENLEPQEWPPDKHYATVDLSDLRRIDLICDRAEALAELERLYAEKAS